MGGNNGPKSAADEIKLIISRAQRLREEIKELKADEKDVYAEAKSRGFDAPTIKKLVGWLEKDPDKRKEEAVLFEMYKMAIGHGDGSLSDMARDYFDQRRAAAPPPSDQLDAFTPTPDTGPKPDVNTDFGDDVGDAPISEDDARRMGEEAAKAGKPVTHNPFKAGDERRAAWDEAWCGALGTDGMEIPDELRPTTKPKKGDKGKGGDDAATDDTDEQEGDDA